MTINVKSLTKSLTLALAAICLSIPFTNVSEAAHHNAPPPPPPRYERHNSDVHFFRFEPPKHHKVCRNPYHARWAQHYHCSKASHNHHNPPPPPHKPVPPHHNHR